MSPIFTNLTNKVYTLEGCAPLPACCTTAAVHTFWKPTAEEITALQSGAVILLTQLGQQVPPTKLDVFAPGTELYPVETPPEYAEPAEPEAGLIIPG